MNETHCMVLDSDHGGATIMVYENVPASTDPQCVRVVLSPEDLGRIIEGLKMIRDLPYGASYNQMLFVAATNFGGSKTSISAESI